MDVLAATTFAGGGGVVPCWDIVKKRLPIPGVLLDGALHGVGPGDEMPSDVAIECHSFSIWAESFFEAIEIVENLFVYANGRTNNILVE